MGGATSEVSGGTRNVLLEAATFEPPSIRRTAKRLGIPSEASYRYERGVDAMGIPFASLRAAALMAKLGGGRLLRGGVDRFPRPAPTVKVGLSLARLRRVSGNDYSLDFAQKQLTRLGMGCAPAPDGLVVTIPSYRPDLTIAEDLVEEILRMGEYGKPARKERIASNATERPNPESPADRARLLLAGAGLAEIVTWAFVPRSALAAISGDGKNARLGQGITLRNPISADYEVMRTSLLPGLADALKRNLSRGVTDASLFEVGTIVRRGGRWRTGGKHACRRAAGRPPRRLAQAGRATRFLRSQERGRRPSCAASASVMRASCPPARRRFSTRAFPPRSGRRRAPPSAAWVSSIRASCPSWVSRPRPSTSSSTSPRWRRRSRPCAPARRRAFPPSPATFRSGSTRPPPPPPSARLSSSAGEPLLVELAVLEDFRDPKYVPAGQKGVLWTMTYRASDRTLTDAEADQAHQHVVAALAATFPIQIR